MTRRVLAVDVGGTTIKGEIFDVDGAAAYPLPGSAREVATPYGDSARDAIAVLGRDLIEAADGAVTHAGVVLPGIVDRTRRVGVMSANVGWHELSVGPELEQAWGIPVVVDHDVTTAGLAEWQAGAGRGCDDLCFVSLGTGIAAALVTGGRLVRGGLDQSGELGHIPIVHEFSNGGPSKRRCGCGAAGCLETVASAAAIRRRYQELSGVDVDDAAQVAQRLDTDAAAQQAWREAVAALALGLSAVIHLLTPTRVVLGGGLSHAGDVLIRPLREALRDKVYAVSVPEVVCAELGSRAGVVGAALIASTEAECR